MSRLLEIQDLRVSADGTSDIVKGISLYIDKGEVVGIAGASGSGKSLAMWSLLGLPPERGRMSGSLLFYNADKTTSRIQFPADLRKNAGRRVSLVPQNPFTSLNPVLRCGYQVAEMLSGKHRKERREVVLQHLKRLGFDEPERIYEAYPFELSGGQLQRVVIAIATINAPELIIADEPTTALDVHTQTEVLSLIMALIKDTDKSLFLVSHDLGLLKKYCHRIYVMSGGEMLAGGTPDEIAAFLPSAPPRNTDEQLTKSASQVLLDVKDLSVRYLGRSGRRVIAVDEVSFQVRSGERLGLIGATGCGKSTIAKAIVALVPKQSGKVMYRGKALDFSRDNTLRREVQMIFQDPYSALYPHLTIAAYLREAIRLHRLCSRNEESVTIRNILERVGLSEDFCQRYPRQLSGGERQRVQIARALLLKPSLLICDEITSGLDAAIQGQILGLLDTLGKESGMAFLIITHDIHVIRYLADTLCVMESGKIVEAGPVNKILSRPQHMITQRLLAAYS